MKEYSNGEITIRWEPQKCIHAGICVKTLPKVYKPNDKPWIEPSNAKSAELVHQIDNCPSGALSYIFNNDEKSSTIVDNEDLNRYELQIEGRTAFIEYIVAKDRIFFTHTEVPSELEGKGIGSRLLLQSLVEVKKKGLGLVPLCPFVAGYLKKYPVWRELVFKGVNIK